jgi:hypothetical protein
MSDNKFRLGRTVITPAAIEAFAKAGELPASHIRRHETGDWGDDITPHDWKANDDALTNGGRTVSAYNLRDKTRMWIITEGDRSSTCVLLPDDY